MVHLDPDLVVIVPSWGRPESARRIARAFDETCTAKTNLLVVVQADDPQCMDYYDVPELTQRYKTAPNGIGGHGFVAPTNWAAAKLMGSHYPPRYIGCMGDDHLPQTKGWDARFITELEKLGTGYAFGNDRIQGPNFSTHIVMTSNIVAEFGYLANPTFQHLYADNCWTDLGRAAGCLAYLDDVVIEHLHYTAGKSEEDDTYRRGNDIVNWDQDPKTYAAWREGPGMEADVARLRKLISGEGD